MLTLPTIVICDLDGTLAIHNGRSPYDFQKCDTDLVCPQVDAVLSGLLVMNTVDGVVFVSGREDSCRDKTEAWLVKAGFTEKTFGLHMRKTGDHRGDDIVKREIYDEHIRDKYNIFCVFDDRPRVIRLWDSLGLYVFAAGGGQREF